MKRFWWFLLLLSVCMPTASLGQQIQTDEILTSQDGSSRVRMRGYYAGMRSVFQTYGCNYLYDLVNLEDRETSLKVRVLRNRYLGFAVLTGPPMDKYEEIITIPPKKIKGVATVLPFDLLGIPVPAEGEESQGLTQFCPAREEVVEIMGVGSDATVVETISANDEAFCSLMSGVFRKSDLEQSLFQIKGYAACKPAYRQIACSIVIDGVKDDELPLFTPRDKYIHDMSLAALFIGEKVSESDLFPEIKTDKIGDPLKRAQDYCRDDSAPSCEQAVESFRVLSIEEKLNALQESPQCTPQFEEAACSVFSQGVDEAALMTLPAAAYIYDMALVALASAGIIQISDIDQSGGISLDIENPVTEAIKSCHQRLTTPAEPSCDPDDEECLNRLQEEIQSTLDRIQRGERFPHRNDGTTFRNLERRLPEKPEGYYTEYVHPTPGVSHAGLRRVVLGKEGEIYYTPDHYKTFIRIK